MKTLNYRATVFAILLSLTLLVPVGATDVMGRIRFAPGTSSATVEGRLENSQRKGNFGNGNDRWALTARRGQSMVIQVQASGPVQVYVWQGDYRQGYLTDGTGPSVQRSVTIPVNGDYNIEISTDNKPVTYSLYVQIN